MKEKYTQMLLPGGEWLENIKKAMRLDGLEIAATSGRQYRYTFVEQALPIVFDIVRSKDIPTTLIDRDTSVAAGFTGSDITEESGQNYLWTYELVSKLYDGKRPMVVLGSTPNLRDRRAEPNIEDLKKTTIYTPYPNMARKLLKNNYNISPTIKERAGKIEGYWRVDKKNGAIVDITSSGETMRENDIKLMEILMFPEVVFMQRENISRQDQRRCDDLREIIYQADYRRGAPEV